MDKIKENKRLSNGYMSFDYEEKHYYDYMRREMIPTVFIKHIKK